MGEKRLDIMQETRAQIVEHPYFAGFVFYQVFRKVGANEARTASDQKGIITQIVCMERLFVHIIIGRQRYPYLERLSHHK